MKAWHRLTGEAVAAPSLEVSQASLDGAWSYLGQWKACLPLTEGWNEIILKVPSNPSFPTFP